MMNILENYRSSLDYREILRILQKSTTLDENFLWQNLPSGRKIIPLTSYEIDFVSREVVVFFDMNQFHLNSAYPLYVKLDYKTSVFKASSFRTDLNGVYFSIPSEIKTLENRAFPRLQLFPETTRVVGLTPIMVTGLRSKNELTAQVFDVSRSGLGVIIPESEEHLYKENMPFLVTRLDQNNLREPLVAKVLYTDVNFNSQYLQSRSKNLKVGLKFSGLLPENIVKSLS